MSCRWWMNCRKASVKCCSWWRWSSLATPKVRACSGWPSARFGPACRGPGANCGSAWPRGMQQRNLAEPIMDEHHAEHMDHDSCVAYYRNTLSARRAVRVQAYLQVHPEVARRARIDAAHERALAQSMD